MPKQQLPLKILALSVFVLFISGFVYYKSSIENIDKPTPVFATANTTEGAFDDTGISKPFDTIQPVTTIMSSSKSMILTKEKALFFPKIIKVKHGKDSLILVPIKPVQPVKDTTLSKANN